MAKKKDVHYFKETRGKASITWCDISIAGVSDKITTELDKVTCEACKKALSVKKHGSFGSK